MFLGVSRFISPSSPHWFLRSRLAFARSATPSRLCYRRLGLKFAVEGNVSTGHGRFLHSLLYFRVHLVQTHTQLPIVSTVFGSTPPPPPPGFVPFLSYSYHPPLFWLAPYCLTTWDPPSAAATVASSVTLGRRIALPRWSMLIPWTRSNSPRSLICGRLRPLGVSLRSSSFGFRLVVLGAPWTGKVSFVHTWWEHGLSFPVASSPCIYLIFLLCPRLVVRVGFLVLRGWRAVGSIPEGLRVMAFSLGR